MRVGFEIIENLKLGFLGVESENLSLFFMLFGHGDTVLRIPSVRGCHISRSVVLGKEITS